MLTKTTEGQLQSEKEGSKIRKHATLYSECLDIQLVLIVSHKLFTLRGR